jgi:hypothetical protein
VGFALPSFQADLERLWITGAAQSEMEAFLSENGVTIEAGQSPTTISFFYRAVFVGTLHRILRQDAATVYEEAKHRFPRLLSADAVPATPDVQGYTIHEPEQPKKLEVPASTRRQKLERQRKVDQLEARLASLRLERLHLVYGQGRGSPEVELVLPSGGPVSPPNPLFDHDKASLTRDEMPYPEHPCAAERGRPHGLMGDRVKLLLHAEAVLEAAVTALWQDHRWTSASLLDLMRFAGNAVYSRNLSTTAGAGRSTDEADSENGCQVAGFRHTR